MLRSCSEFYTVIPHDFGFKNMRKLLLNSKYKVALVSGPSCGPALPDKWCTFCI